MYVPICSAYRKIDIRKLLDGVIKGGKIPRLKMRPNCKLSTPFFGVLKYFLTALAPF